MRSELMAVLAAFYLAAALGVMVIAGYKIGLIPLALLVGAVAAAIEW
jgi:hypothetical protein